MRRIANCAASCTPYGITRLRCGLITPFSWSVSCFFIFSFFSMRSASSFADSPTMYDIVRSGPASSLNEVSGLPSSAAASALRLNAMVERPQEVMAPIRKIENNSLAARAHITVASCVEYLCTSR